MIVSELIEYYRDLVDEPRLAFLSAANVRTYLAQGYEDFRALVAEIDQWVYIESATITMGSSAKVYDLGDAASAVTLFGADATLTGPRMAQLLRVADETSNWPIEYRGASTLQALATVERGYILQGTKLRFWHAPAATLEIYYRPESAVDWTVGTSFIDNLTPYHDLIALLAVRHYEARDAAVNKVVSSELASRKDALISYLAHRNADAARSGVVVTEDW